MLAPLHERLENSWNAFQRFSPSGRTVVAGEILECLQELYRLLSVTQIRMPDGAILVLTADRQQWLPVRPDVAENIWAQLEGLRAHTMREQTDEVNSLLSVASRDWGRRADRLAEIAREQTRPPLLDTDRVPA